MEKLPTNTTTCSRCKQNKSLDEFKLECKLCKRCLEITKLYRQRHKEEIQQKQRENYYENRDMILNRRKEYIAENREKVLQQKKEYRERNKEKNKEARRLYYEKKNRETLLENQRQTLEKKKEIQLNEMD